MPVKILILTSSYPTRDGTHEGGFIADLVRRLPERGVLPVVLAPHFPGGQFKEFRDGILIFRFPYFFPLRLERLAYGAGLLFNIRRDFFAFAGIIPFCKAEFLWTQGLLFRERVDIIHTHWLIPQGLIGALIHRFIRIPHVATIHGSDLNLIKNNNFLTFLCRFIVKNSDAITVNSTYMKQQLLSVDPDSVQKIQVIPMGVDLEKYQKVDISDVKQKFGTNHIILSVGRLIDWKGTIHLIDAMPMVLQHNPNTLLLIIGSGPEKEHLVQRTHELSLEEKVKFLGKVNDDDLVAYYHVADVFVLPSVNKSGKTEGLGVVLLEAMASGCPVIGSNVGGIPDIITDCENGFVVPERDSIQLAERIVRLLLDTELRETFRKNGYNKIKESFSWDRISNQFASVYQQVLVKRRN
jgi:N-acetyl-alpha-D-glucosaminyl L-malate synthase BshA